MKPVKLAMIGAGMMGQRAHLEQYMSWPDCTIVALAEPRPELARKVAARYGIQHVFANHLELLANTDCDGLVCIQPYAHHRYLLPDLYASGKPLITEKPLALSVEAGEELVVLAEKHQVIHMVGYHKRSDPAMEYAKKQIDAWKADKLCGQMTFLRVTMPPGDWAWQGFAATLTSREDYPPVILERASSLAGLTDEQAQAYDRFVNYYIHQVNAIRYLLGEDYRLTYADKAGHLLVGESDSGISVVLEMAPWHNTVAWQESYLACFEKATIQVDLPAPLASQQPGSVKLMLDNSADMPCTLQPMLPPIAAMRNQARNFIDVVRGGKRAPCLAEEALKDLNLARDYIRLHDRSRAVSASPGNCR